MISCFISLEPTVGRVEGVGGGGGSGCFNAGRGEQQQQQQQTLAADVGWSCERPFKQPLM